MFSKGKSATGRKMYLIVKNEDNKSSFLCNKNHSDVIRIGTDTELEDSIHQDIIVWTDEIDDSVYSTASLDEAVGKLMYLSGFEEYWKMIIAEDLRIAEVNPTYTCENLIIGSEMVDYWKKES